jgi:hypothetical protein
MGGPVPCSVLYGRHSGREGTNTLSLSQLEIAGHQFGVVAWEWSGHRAHSRRAVVGGPQRRVVSPAAKAGPRHAKDARTE